MARGRPGSCFPSPAQHPCQGPAAIQAGQGSAAQGWRGDGEPSFTGYNSNIILIAIKHHGAFPKYKQLELPQPKGFLLGNAAVRTQ